MGIAYIIAGCRDFGIYGVIYQIRYLEYEFHPFRRKTRNKSRIRRKPPAFKLRICRELKIWKLDPRIRGIS